MSDGWTKVLAIFVVIIGLVFIGFGIAAFVGYIPLLVRWLGGITAVLLGVFMAYWGVQKVRGVKDPFSSVTKPAEQEARGAGLLSVTE